MPSKRKLFILVVTLIAIAAVVGGGLLTTGALGVDTETQSFTYMGVTGGGGSGNRNPDVGGELNDQDLLIASWSPQLIGQRVSVNGVVKLHRCGELLGVSTCVPKVDQFEVIVKLVSPGGVPTPVTGWRTEVGTVIINEDTWSPVMTTGYWDVAHPDGKTVIPDGWHVEVDMLVHVLWKTALGETDKGWGVVAIDRAVIKSGIGNVYWKGAHGSGDGIYYITGETAQACWNVGYVQDEIEGRGWSIYIWSEARNAVVLQPTPITELAGCVSYVVQEADFYPFKATLQAFLKNELFLKDFKGVTAIRAQDVAKMPTCSVSGISPQSPKQGDPVTISFACVAASSNQSDQVKLIRFTWGWGSPDNSVDLAGTATSHVIVASQPGLLNVQITAYTNTGVPSGTANYVISVEHQPTNPCLGSLSFCNTNTGGGLPLWIVFVLIGIAAIVLGIIIPAIPIWPWKILIILAGVILILVAIVVRR